MLHLLSGAVAHSKADNSNTGQWPKYSGFKALKPNCKEIRLLQLEHGADAENMRYVMRHEKLRSSLSYSAVSYSWGAPVPVGALREISINGLVVRIRPTLYAFLEAMKIHDQGMSIWIDAICINQSDVVERNDQISIMSEIFKTAQGVYVWLGPGDDDTSYAMDHIENHQPQTLYDSVTFSICAEKLLKASYWTRRWVIQEFALARELTIVCGGRLTKWSNLVNRLGDYALSLDASARQTLKNFEGVRLLGSPEQEKGRSLLELMGRFHDTRCIDLRDRAFALRGIAVDGYKLSPHYEESAADVYFRVLSMLPTERVLPAMSGYRWPNEAASRLLKCMPITRQDVLDSLKSPTNDRLYTVFEFIGIVATVEDRFQGTQERSPTDQFRFFHLKVGVCGSTTRVLCGTSDLLKGDIIYSLQSTSQSPKGLYIAFRPCRTDSAVAGMLIEEPDSGAATYWASVGLCEKKIGFIRHVTFRGLLKCSYNNSEKSLQIRILCHISRVVLILLWLLDMGQLDHLYARQEEIFNSSFRMSPTCNCDQEEIRPPGPGFETAAHQNSTTELLPSFNFQQDETFWAGGTTLPWVDLNQQWPQEHPESRVCQWQSEDTLGFSYHGRTGLSYAAGDGLILFTKYFLSERSVQVNSPDNDGKTPLWWATYNGHDQEVRMLLDAGADANAQGGWYGNVLQEASAGGHEEVVKTLLDAGADVNAQGGRYGNALWAASAVGHEEVVKTLLDAGADVNAQGGRYGNALWAASAGGHEEVVKTLLDAGADVNAQGGRYGNALRAASAGGHKELVKILLDAGADVNAQGGRYGNALQAASAGGHKEVVKMLLGAGAVGKQR